MMAESFGTGASLEEFEPSAILRVEDYRPYIGPEGVEKLKRLADPVAGKGWANLNSTFEGGGVAEMLRSLIPLARGLGVQARWYGIRGSEEFFQVTKKFHNLLQGEDQPISLEEIFGAYLDTINTNARKTYIVSDLVVIHDPQPAAMVMNGVLFGNVLWRCHIDTSQPNQTIWRFLLPYINQCAGAIFTMPEFIGPGLQVPLYQVAPCIDPLAPKNRLNSRRTALDILAPLFQQHGVDPERPILTAISRYDIHKNQSTILKAFKRLREVRKTEPTPYLIFLGNTATDDPEGGLILDRLKAEAGSDPDVRFWSNVDDNDRVVGALMRIARAMVHISTREGFGLVVAEALWQGTPVIGSQVGGITRQVIDGRTGYLAAPMDAEIVAARMAHLLDHPDTATALGAYGREHIRRHFLLPSLLERYLSLLRFYSGVHRDPPDFRLDDLAYSEIMQAVKREHPVLAQSALPGLSSGGALIPTISPPGSGLPG